MRWLIGLRVSNGLTALSLAPVKLMAATKTDQDSALFNSLKQ